MSTVRPALHRSPAAVALCLAAVLTATTAGAQAWTEVGDAGGLVPDAQTTMGSGSLTSITGQLAAHGDIDVFCVQLTAVPPAGLPLVSLNPCATMSDPGVYLFDAAGVGISGNLTCSGGMKQVPAPPYSLTPGSYYVAVSHYDWTPQSSGGAIFPFAFTGPLWPTGPGGASPLAGWIGPLTFVPPIGYTLTLNPNYFTYCDVATATESTTWGSLKARYDD